MWNKNINISVHGLILSFVAIAFLLMTIDLHDKISERAVGCRSRDGEPFLLLCLDKKITIGILK